MKTIFSTHTPPFVWAILVIATGVTFAIGQQMAPNRGLILLVFGLAFIKGSLVILDFLELRHAPALWRRIVLGWLLVVIAGIVATYLKGSP